MDATRTVSDLAASLLLRGAARSGRDPSIVAAFAPGRL
jgi:hypothetical protein